MSDIGEFAMFLAVGFASASLFLGPIGRALGRWIEGKVGRSAGPELEELSARVAELEARGPITGETDLVARRLAELEERVDFTERLLAQGKDRARLAGGGADG